jgi:uncharacterized protein YjbJ (UPF0337 family)
MGLGDKAKDKAEELSGKAKAAMGDATDNPDLEAEGRMQEANADVKQACENARTAAMTLLTPSVQPAVQRRLTTEIPCGKPRPRHRDPNVSHS